MGKEDQIKSREQLLSEIDELQSRLSQAEETLDAIRNGEVDAIVVSGNDGEMVFSLATSETPYRIIIEELNEGAVTISSTGTILYSNRRFSELISRPLEQIIGSDFSEYIDPEKRNEFGNLLSVGLHQKVQGEISSRIHGRTIQLQLSLVPLPANMEGDICIVVTDITEISTYQNYLQEMVEERSFRLKEANRQLSEDIEKLREAEEQMKNSEKRYRRLFESAQDGIIIFEAERGVIVDANPVMKNSLGYTCEEILDKPVWELKSFRNIFSSKEEFMKYQENEYVHLEDVELYGKDGRIINAEFVSTVFMIDHKKVIQANIRDITQRKIAETSLKESETRLRELNATKDKFFSIITHDLKGPFTSIIGFSELIIERISLGQYDEVKEFASIVHNSSWKVMHLLTNLIEWSKMQTGRIEFFPSEVDICSIVDEVTELINDSAWQKSIVICREIKSETNVVADKAMISTVLRNLLSNAVKFTRPGGKIIISSEQTDSDLLISVKDNGIGINREMLDKLFRIDESPTTRGTKGEEGTGLGLVLCKEFVKRHGGEIWVESEVDKGSRFVFTLPLHKNGQWTI